MATLKEIENLLELQAEKICNRVKGETEQIINEKLTVMEEGIAKVQENVDINSNQIKILEEKNFELDMQARKKNVIMFNVMEDPAAEPNLSDNISTLLKEGSKVEKSDIDVIHRIGKKNGKPRPIMIKFVSERAKRSVMTNIKFYAMKKISIFEDTPKELSDLRKKVNPLVSRLRKEKKKVFVNLKKFEVDGISWPWQDVYKKLEGIEIENKRIRSPETEAAIITQPGNSGSGAIPKRFAYNPLFQGVSVTPSARAAEQPKKNE